MIAAAPCIRGVRYAFPATSHSVRQLATEGRLESDPELLERFGFGQVYIAVKESPFELALHAARTLLDSTETDPASIELLIFGGSPGTLAFTPADGQWDGRTAIQTTDRFKYPATRLQYELGLDNASVLGLDQLACTTLFSALRVARSLCITESIERVLCVTSEFFPADAGREAIFNCTSDAACAVLVERTGDRNRLVASTHVTKGYYWDCDVRRNEIIASYFPTAKHVIERVIEKAGWSGHDVDWVMPHNVSMRSWELLLGLLQLPKARLWSQNIARHGHTLAGDNFINLCDALESRSVDAGQRVLLFSYGYGAHWTALALEA